MLNYQRVAIIDQLKFPPSFIGYLPMAFPLQDAPGVPPGVPAQVAVVQTSPRLGTL